MKGEESENEIERFQSIFEQTIVGIAETSLDGKLLLVNDRYCEILGRTRKELLGMSIQELTHQEDLPGNLHLFQEMVSQGKPFELEKRYLRPDHSAVWVRVHVSILKDKSGAPVSTVAVVLDISEQKVQAELKEERAKRNKFLSDVSLILNGSLDLKETLSSITKLAVPDFGDWCYIHLANSEGKLELSDCSSADPSKKDLVREFAIKTVSKIGTTPNAVISAFQSGTSVMRNLIEPEYYEKVAGNPRQLDLFRALAPRSVIVVPLKSFGKILGTITVAYAQDRAYSGSELEHLEEVAIRAGLALDNARIYADSRKAIKSRDEFVSVASHELKTPLTSLMLLNQINLKKLEKEALDGNTESLAHIFHEYGVHIFRMSRLVEDMLDITRIQLGSYQLNVSEVNLDHSIRQTCDQLLPQIISASCKLEISTAGDLTGNFDGPRIQQVISNIVTNAFKYAPGKIIRVSAVASADEISISIADEGRGIEEENLQRIFERFERAISPSSVSGLGLGLYISRRIIEAHNGKIWAESKIGKGTSLHIRLPRKAP